MENYHYVYLTLYICMHMWQSEDIYEESVVIFYHLKGGTPFIFCCCAQYSRFAGLGTSDPSSPHPRDHQPILVHEGKWSRDD